jgi:hypothetical protein
MRGRGEVSANKYSFAHRSPNKLWRSKSIFNLWPLPFLKVLRSNSSSLLTAKSSTTTGPRRSPRLSVTSGPRLRSSGGGPDMSADAGGHPLGSRSNSGHSTASSKISSAAERRRILSDAQLKGESEFPNY